MMKSLACGRLKCTSVRESKIPGARLGGRKAPLVPVVSWPCPTRVDASSDLYMDREYSSDFQVVREEQADQGNRRTKLATFSSAVSAVPGLVENLNSVLSALFGSLRLMMDELEAMCRVLGTPMHQTVERAQSSLLRNTTSTSSAPAPAPAPASAPATPTKHKQQKQATTDKGRTKAADPTTSPPRATSSAVVSVSPSPAPSPLSLQVPEQYHAALGGAVIAVGLLGLRAFLRRRRQQQKEAAARELEARAERLRQQKLRMAAALATNRVMDRRMNREDAESIVSTVEEEPEEPQDPPGESRVVGLDEKELEAYRKFLGGAKLPTRERIWTIEELTKGRFER